MDSKLFNIYIEYVTLVFQIIKPKWDLLTSNRFSTFIDQIVWDLNPSIKWDQLSQFKVQIKGIL
jgi:hypothetical protein